MGSFVTLQTGAALFIVIIFFYFLRYLNNVRLPPGPRPLPIIGNIRDLPRPGRAEYLHWLEHKDVYGPISSITILGQPMIFIHDSTAADVILEKASLKTSGRPVFPFASECGFDSMMPSRQYDANTKRYRKFMNQQLGTRKSVLAFKDIQDEESKRLLLAVLNDSKNLIDHLKKATSAIILKITYGYSIGSQMKDPLADLIEELMVAISNAYVPMSWAVDFIPQLHHLPDGFPGTGFKKIASKGNQLLRATLDVPYSFVEGQITTGANKPSYVSALIQRLGDPSRGGKLSKADEDTTKETATIIYGGGADTTFATLNSFILAMVLFPEVQQKAQKEIDNVTGSSRLPGFEDRNQLPYINALVKECLRWFPILPLGITHRADEEIVYRDFRIPKGAYIVPSIWWFLNDPDVYSSPSSFDPERFLEPRNEADPSKHAFGYGCRICPGRYLAVENLFITISRVLATFDISRAVDVDGRDLEVKVEPTPGLINHPARYPYVIKPRSENHADLIRAIEKDHPWEKGDAGLLDLDLSASSG